MRHQTRAGGTIWTRIRDGIDGTGLLQRPGAADPMETAVRRLAVAATVGMFLVLVLGATVTNTGSAEGCGRSWPLCHGEFIPEFTVSTAMEYSHRAVTGLEGLLV